MDLCPIEAHICTKRFQQCHELISLLCGNEHSNAELLLGEFYEDWLNSDWLLNLDYYCLLGGASGLRNDPAITILRADFGNATVVMDATDYIEKMTNHLNTGLYQEENKCSRNE